MKIRLRTKMIAFTIILVMVIMAVVTYFFTIREIEIKRTALNNQIEKLAQNIATLQLVDQQEWSIYQDYINQVMDANKDIVYIAVYDEHNSLRAHTLNTDLIELKHPVISQRQQAIIVEQLDQGLVADESQKDIHTAKVNIMINDRIIGSVHVGYSLININDQQREGILFNLMLAGIFTLIFSIAAFIISRRLAYPLEQLNEAILRVTEGDLSKTLIPQTHDEIADLVFAYNAMIENMRERKIIDALGQELSATFRLEELVSLVTERLRKAINANDVHLYISDPNNPVSFNKITGSSDNLVADSLNIKTASVSEFLYHQKNGFVLNEAPDVVQKLFCKGNKKISGLIIPMIHKQKITGILFFTLSDEQIGYSVKEIDFAKSLSAPAGLALENALLYDELREQERLKHELEIARDIQQKLLPKGMPELEGFDIEAFCNSATEVGGDYFDFFELGRDKLGIVIADVSGKGTSASFYMAQLKGMMMQSVKTFKTPRELLYELNQKIYASLDKNLFITMIYGNLDAARHELTIARAGHNALIHIKENKSYTIYTPPGIGLGLDPGEIFKRELQEIRIKLNPKDTLLFYTDGITEARKNDAEEFGDDRLLQAVLESKKDTVKQKRDNIQKKLQKFLNGEKPEDDITLIIIDCNFKM